MKNVLAVTIVVIGTVLSQNSSSDGIQNRYLNQEKYLEIKARAKTWEPFKPEEHPLKHLTEDEIMMRIGVKVRNSGEPARISQLLEDTKNVIGSFGINLNDASAYLNSLNNLFNVPKEAVTLPSSFDPRLISAWAPCIHAVRE